MSPFLRKQAFKNALRGVLGERTYVQVSRLLRSRREHSAYGERAIAPDSVAGAVLMRDVLARAEPAAIGKIGASELRTCREVGDLLAGRRRRLSASIRHELHLHSGVFPPLPDTLVRFAALFEGAGKDIDVLAVWFLPGEREFVDQHVSRARLVRLLALEPYCAPDPPWSALLAGKRVVVVSPFARSIAAQYARRTEVWAACPAVLPEFSLRTVRAPLSDYLVKSPHADWFAALDHLKAELAGEPFDVAIIGAGAFSIPLAVEAKRLGGIGIHLGGATQLLFGVLGGRWTESETLRPLVNDTWVRPSGDEVPPDYRKMEGGCYW